MGVILVCEVAAVFDEGLAQPLRQAGCRDETVNVGEADF
ncbi:hypothetical protein FM111_01970 [Brevundimonas diminuta 3F5N]|uniref:Uncharacterized protein n=1 Tax=Brevundimonas diminuta 3F5N TaxID=1255603 RepID=A0A1R4F156_BREDI|nr:hypothetical protein FM111_01970 [Brevundimonas diminuta 3F5N]